MRGKKELGAERIPVVKELPERFNELGSFIREQRGSARLSLRRLSELAGISNPYLSQIERGLRRPSAEILQQIAKALRISAETLYVQAGILEKPDGNTDLARHIFGDNNLNEEQKQALMRIYLSFRHENEDNADLAAAAASASPASSPGDAPSTEATVAVEASVSGAPSESPSGAEGATDRGSVAG
ncbi:MAG TPA: helix-turn-helix transcriptional regulator [Acidimicrobiales bacterium]|nr:helix-turn-helix transcriptional regulator [Acidimicrobiales bacterium]